MVNRRMDYRVLGGGKTGGCDAIEGFGAGKGRG